MGQTHTHCLFEKLYTCSLLHFWKKAFGIRRGNGRKGLGGQDGKKEKDVSVSSEKDIQDRKGGKTMVTLCLHVCVVSSLSLCPVLPHLCPNNILYSVSVSALSLVSL